MLIPEPLRKVIDALSRLPSIGPRQGTRLAFHLLQKGPHTLQSFADGLSALTSMQLCGECFFPTLASDRPEGVETTPTTLCDICKNLEREKGTIMIIERETDLLSIENTKKFSGKYLILGPIAKTGMLSDLQKLRLESLKTRIHKNENGKIEEIILGFNPTVLGDFQSSVLINELAPFTKKISRLGRGLPTGGEIEFADDETLGSALLGRG